MSNKVELEIGGRTLTFTTGHVAKQANGAVTVQYGDSMVISTVCAEKEPKEGFDFFPLTVEYREKSYAAGKIPGGFFKREARPSEKEILSARAIDRPIRPLFPDDFKGETQCITYVVSHDQLNDTDILAINGTAAALAISDAGVDRRTHAARHSQWRGRARRVHVGALLCDPHRRGLDGRAGHARAGLGLDAARTALVCRTQQKTVTIL